MAFNNKTNNPLDPTGRAILVQVALKGAIELVSSGRADITEIGDWTRDLTKILTDEVQVQKDAFFDSLPAKAATTGGAAEQLADEFGATDVSDDADGGSGIQVLNKDRSPEPIEPWALAQFKAAGVTKVFDNRTTKSGKQPWYKTPKDADKYGEPADKGFWPPRN